MSYDINLIAADLAEAEMFEDELAPYLEALEDSSGVILIENRPAFPCSGVGLTLEAHLGTYLLSYDLLRFAVVKQHGLFHETVVYHSIRRYLDKAEPTGLSHFLEVTLFKELL